MQQPFNSAAQPTPAELGQQLLEEVSKRAECDEARALALIEAGAALEEKRRGSTALNWAAFNNHPAIARRLIERGADLDSRDATDKTALDWAIQYNHQEVADLLRGALKRREEARADAARREQEDFEAWRDFGMPLKDRLTISAPLRLKGRVS